MDVLLDSMEIIKKDRLNAIETIETVIETIETLIKNICYFELKSLL
jgi:hypothetical protein